MSERNGPMLRRSVALVWRNLRSMRTALVLLLILAAGAVIGSLVPQIPNSPERVGRYLTQHGFWGPLFFRAGFFDVFGSWWFVLVMTLLFISLAACIAPRSRAAFRALRQRPVMARELQSFPHYAEIRVGREPRDTAVMAERLLRRKRFRRARDGTTVAAEKGALREAGSLLFHWSFFLLLLGVIVGKGTGFTGRAVVVEGETWTDARANYAGDIRTGRYSSGRFSGIGIHLVDFDVAYRRSGLPRDFVSRVRLSGTNGASLGGREIRVNHPIAIAGLRVFQEGFGWAPVVTASLDGDLVWSSPIVMRRDNAPAGVPATAMPWRGAIKLIEPGPDVMVILELWPDYRALAILGVTGRPTPMLVSFDPYIRYSVFVGQITDPSRASMDTIGLRRAGRGDLRAAGTSNLDVPGIGRVKLTFPELRQYTVLLISRDIGVYVVLAAAILILLGLLPALFVSRRKLWVRVEPTAGGSIVKIGGFALQRKDAFEEEFARIVRSLEASGQARSPTRESVATP